MNYEEKLKEAKRLYQTANSNQKYVLESLFPELKESEDEKIRKALIRFHKSTIDVDGIKGEDIIAWLEKQGTSYTKRDVDDAFVEGMAFAKDELEKQGEQKPLDYENANIQQKDFAPKATTANRQLYNRAILAILSNYVEKYPDIRFGQMLFNLGVKPHFNQESKETYCNLNETINKKS